MTLYAHNQVSHVPFSGLHNAHHSHRDHVPRSETAVSPKREQIAGHNKLHIATYILQWACFPFFYYYSVISFLYLSLSLTHTLDFCPATICRPCHSHGNCGWACSWPWLSAPLHWSLSSISYFGFVAAMRRRQCRRCGYVCNSHAVWRTFFRLCNECDSVCCLFFMCRYFAAARTRNASGRTTRLW